MAPGENEFDPPDLGCFYTSAVFTNAAMNSTMSAEVSLRYFTSFRYVLRNGIAGSYGTSIPGVLGSLHTVPTVPAAVYSPTGRAPGLPFPISTPVLVIS